MRFRMRLLQRLAILGLGVLTVWLVVFVVFKITDRRLPWILALRIADRGRTTVNVSLVQSCTEMKAVSEPCSEFLGRIFGCKASDWRV